MNEGKHGILPSQIASVAQRWFTASVATQGVTSVIPNCAFHCQRQVNGGDAGKTRACCAATIQVDLLALRRLVQPRALH